MAGPAIGVHCEALVVQGVGGKPATELPGAAFQAHVAVQQAGRAIGVLAAVAAAIGRHRARKALADGARDDVDHAAHGRTAVLRRAGPLDHLHPVHLGQQVLGDIHRGAGAGRDRQAVDQHQHLVAGHALQRHLVAGFAVDFPQLQAGHVLQRVFQRARMRALDFLPIHHLGTDGRLVDRLLRTGSGDHHGWQFLAIGRQGRGRRPHGKQGTGNERNACEAHGLGASIRKKVRMIMIRINLYKKIRLETFRYI
ncbi:hypothetical protein D3C86_1450590 [compost metagenome]